MAGKKSIAWLIGTIILICLIIIAIFYAVAKNKDMEITEKGEIKPHEA